MGQNRTIDNLPAPRIFGTNEERHKYDMRVYDALVRLYGLVSALQEVADTLTMDLGALSLTAGAGGVEVLLQATDGTTVSATTAETAFTPSLDLDHEVWEDGAALRFLAAGVMNSTGSGPQVAIRIKLDSQLLLSTGYVTVAGGVDVANTAAPWRFEGTITCRTTGNGGVLMSTGTGFIAAGGVATALGNTSATTLDLSIPLNLSISAQWDTADALNAITLQTFTVERLPPP